MKLRSDRKLSIYPADLQLVTNAAETALRQKFNTATLRVRLPSFVQNDPPFEEMHDVSTCQVSLNHYNNIGVKHMGFRR